MVPPLPIVTLLYHSVYGAEESRVNYDISSGAFEAHARRISEGGHACIGVHDLCVEDPLGTNREGGVLVTFDDGRLDNYEVVSPILGRYEVRATFFVTPGKIGSSGYMSWWQLRELARHGMPIQSHGLTHRFLHTLSAGELDDELRVSKSEIEDRVGNRVEFLSLPGGFYSRRVLEAAWDNGYRGVFTSDPGIDRIDRPARRLMLRRYNITRSTSLEELSNILGRKAGTRLKYIACHRIKATARWALGSDAYYRVWSKLFKYLRRSGP